jgi:MFS family permease
MNTTTIDQTLAESLMTRSEKIALALLCTTQFMLVLDGIIMNVAIAKIQESLSFAPQALQWVVNAYTLAFGGFLLLGGRAADLLGKRRVLIAGIALFTLASLVGALSPNGAVLVAARAVQGLGAALASPASMSFIAELSPAGRKRDRAFGAMGAIAAAGAASGVLLGGLLTGAFGWESVLLINVPVGLGLIVAAGRLLPSAKAARTLQSLDLAGAVTITAALELAVYALVGAPTTGWGSLHTLGLLATAACLAGLFIGVERRSPHPLVQFSMLRNPRLVSSVATALVHAAGPMTVMYFLSLHLQQSLNYSPMQTGLAFLPMSVMAAVGAMAASRIVGRLGTAKLMVGGLLTMAGGLALLSLLPTNTSYALHLLPGIMVVGMGITLTAVPMTISAMSSVKAQDTGLASGLLNTSQQIGAALVLALLVAVSAAVAPQAGAAASSISATRWAFIVASVVLIAGALMAHLAQAGNPEKKKA